MRIFLLIILVFYSAQGFTEIKNQPTFALELTEVSALIKSSKTKYEDSYLFIAKAKSFKASNGDIVVPAGTIVEFLLPKKACLRETYLAFDKQDRKLTISNMLLKKLNLAAPGKPYEYFAILDIAEVGERTLAGCKISKK